MATKKIGPDRETVWLEFIWKRTNNDYYFCCRQKEY